MTPKEKWIHFWLFGPEFGCVRRELPIIQSLHAHRNVLLVVHKNHVSPLREYFKDSQVEIIPYRHGINLEYDMYLNLNLGRSMLNLARFAAYQWIGDYRIFRNSIKYFTPAVIISDFLPYVSLWARFHHVATIGVYNYAFAYTHFGKGIINRLLNHLVPTLFPVAYRIPNRMFIESISRRELRNGTCIPIIKRHLQEGASCNSKDNFFIALGGKSDPRAILEKFEKVHQIAPQLKFWIAPRNEDEILDSKEVFHIVDLNSPFSTFEIMEKVDGIISKAGFSTVAEALQFKKKLFIIRLENHPEIMETERTLLELGLARSISLDSEPEELVKILTTPFENRTEVSIDGMNHVLNEIKKWV